MNDFLFILAACVLLSKTLGRRRLRLTCYSCWGNCWINGRSVQKSKHHHLHFLQNPRGTHVNIYRLSTVLSVLLFYGLAQLGLLPGILHARFTILLHEKAI